MDRRSGLVACGRYLQPIVPAPSGTWRLSADAVRRGGPTRPAATATET